MNAIPYQYCQGDKLDRWVGEKIRSKYVNVPVAYLESDEKVPQGYHSKTYQFGEVKVTFKAKESNGEIRDQDCEWAKNQGDRFQSDASGYIDTLMKMDKNVKLATFLQKPHTRKGYSSEDKANEKRIMQMITAKGGAWNTCMGRTHHYEAPTEDLRLRSEGRF